ncbi:MAG: metallophosphoesterase family protein [Gammaproteobacteria bacterium]
MPKSIPSNRRTVYPVLGSKRLGDQVKRLQSSIHVYGHSHVNQSVEIEGTRYINNAFAYPSENRIARKALHCVYEAS